MRFCGGGLEKRHLGGMWSLVGFFWEPQYTQDSLGFFLRLGILFFIPIPLVKGPEPTTGRNGAAKGGLEKAEPLRDVAALAKVHTTLKGQ